MTLSGFTLKILSVILSSSFLVIKAVDLAIWTRASLSMYMGLNSFGIVEGSIITPS